MAKRFYKRYGTIPFGKQAGGEGRQQIAETTNPSAMRLARITTMKALQQDRIVLIDALRGYALMGLFLVHMVEYYELLWYPPPQSLDHVTYFMFALFGGKAYAMFAMLFGVSFYIIISRNANRGVDFRGRFVWRLFLLLAMGYLHGLMYSGDVLQILAVTGLLLVPLWVAPNWVVVLLGGALVLQTTTLAFISWIAHSPIDYQQTFSENIQELVYPYYAQGSLLDVLSQNALGGTAVKWLFMAESGRLANVLGLGLIGFWLARIGFFTDEKKYKNAYVITLAVVLSLAGILHLMQPELMAIPHAAKVHDAWIGLIETYMNLLMMFTTVLVLVLLFRVPVIGRVLSLLAAPGRMTLTCYVGQSLVMVPFFYGFGLAAYRWIGSRGALLLGIVLWIAQVAGAHWWLRNFNYGPLEWCWRAATYGTTAIPFKRKH